MPTHLSALEQCIRAKRDDAARRAIDNLARYKFDRFGYYAARWVTLNAIIGDKQPNPFRAIVKFARSLSDTELSLPVPGRPEATKPWTGIVADHDGTGREGSAECLSGKDAGPRAGTESRSREARSAKREEVAGSV